MKKISNKRLSHHFPSVVLYREDLEEIYNMIKGVSKEVSITSGDYSFDSINDLKDNSPAKIKNLSITGNYPYISLSFGKEWHTILLYTYGENVEVEAIFYRIKNILNDRRLSIVKYFPPILEWTWVLSFIFVFALKTDVIISTFPSKCQRLSLFLFPILLSLSTQMLNNGSLYAISADSRVKSSFMERNKDQIILLIIGAAIGAFFAKLFN